MAETPTKRSGPRRVATTVRPQREAMQEGRRQATAVRNYLEALRQANAPKRRGRQRTPETVTARLQAIEAELADGVDALKELLLIQERMNLTEELKRMEASRPNPADFEEAFISVAAAYSERQGISFAAWRQLGVPANILKKAKITT